MFRKMILALLLATLTACASGVGGYGPKTTTGAAAGGAASGLIGSQVGGAAATAAGVLLGGLLGATVGQQMDSRDYYRMRSSLETSRAGQSTEWHNPDTGAHYQVIPTRTYENQSGQPCREFNTTAQIDGRRQNVRSQWEYTHATRAVLQIIGLSALVLSVLLEIPRDHSRDRTSIKKGV